MTMEIALLRFFKIMVFLFTFAGGTVFQAQMPNWVSKPFIYVHEKTLKKVLASVWTPSARSALAWTSGGMIAGGLVGLGSAAGEPLACFSIVYRMTLCGCMGGCLGYGIQRHQKWLKQVALQEESIISKVEELEKIKRESLDQVQLAKSAVQKTQKLFEERCQKFNDAQCQLTKMLQDYKESFEVKIGGIDTQVQQCVRQSTLDELYKKITALRAVFQSATQ